MPVESSADTVQAMDKKHTDEWARTAWRCVVHRAAISLAAGLERKAGRFMTCPSTKLEAREALQLAKWLREEARKVAP